MPVPSCKSGAEPICSVPRARTGCPEGPGSTRGAGHATPSGHEGRLHPPAERSFQSYQEAFPQRLHTILRVPWSKKGLSLNTRKEIQEEHYQQYQQANKKKKGKILDELEGTTGQTKDYLAWVLTSYEKTSWVTTDGKRVKLIAGTKKRKSKKRIAVGGRPRKYYEGCITALTKIWGFFDRPCGARWVPFIRHAIDFLEASEDPDCGISGDIRQLLLEISNSYADRLLQPARKPKHLASACLHVLTSLKKANRSSGWNCNDRIR